MTRSTKIILLAACWLFVAAECAISHEAQHDDNLAEESGEIAQSSYVLPKQIFNDGKPFYLEKNPLSGALDFNSKKTSLLTSPEAIGHLSDKDITLNSNNIQAPNLYDYLNLPVKYTSSKFVYPLVSSSYANLKYQGNNKNFVSNHKNDTTTNKVSMSSYGYPSYSSHGDGHRETGMVVDKTPTTPTAPTRTTLKPFESTTTDSTTTTTIPPPTTSQQLPSTRRPQFTRPPLKYTTNKYKYSTIRKRPYITMDSSTEPSVTMEYSPTTPTRPPPSTESTTLRPISKLFHPTHAFRPLPATTTSLEFTTKGSADVYANMATAKTSTTPKTKKKDPNDMSLSELFNSLLDDDEDTTTGSLIDDDDPTAMESNAVKDTSIQIQQNSTLQNIQPKNQSDSNASFQNGQHIHVTSSQEIDSSPTATTSKPSNKIVFTREPTTLITTSKPQMEVSTGNPVPPVDNFHFDVGYNAPMHPQGFTLAATTPSPLSPPRHEFTEEQLVLRPEQPSSSSIRFPVRDHFDNAPIVNGVYKHEPNGHGAPPLALPQQSNGLVVFPANKQQIITSVGVDPVVQQEAISNQSNFVSFGFEKPSLSGDASIGNPVKFVNIPLNPSGQSEDVFQVPVQAEMNYPSMANDLTAAFPGQNNPTQPIDDPNNARPNRLHLTQKQKQQLQQHANEHIQNMQQRPPPPPHHHPNKPPPQQFQQLPHHERYPVRPNQNAQRPPPSSAIGDRLLPNILPQFRPNAKIGYGAPNGGHHKDATEQMRQPPLQPQFNNRRVQQQNLHRPPPPPLQFRRPPLTSAGGLRPGSSSFNVKMAPVSDEPQPNPNRRYFQPRPNTNERVFNAYVPPQATNHRFIDEHPPHSQTSVGVLDAASAGSSFGVKETRQSEPTATDDEIPTKLEPVITLQQLQHKKLLQKDGVDQHQLLFSQQHAFNPDTPIAVHTASDKPPVYVVYPVKTSPLKLEVVGDKDLDDGVVVGHRGEHPPMPPADISASPPGNEYQNTPFTVIRQEQKPILVVKPKLRFPYPLQRPSGELVGHQDRLINIKPSATLESDDETSYNIGEKPVGQDTENEYDNTSKFYR